MRRHPDIRVGLDSLSKQIETPMKILKTTPMSPAEPAAWQQPGHKHLHRQRTLTKAVTMIRSKSKTRQLVELCEQLLAQARKPDVWLQKYERFFQSPVWKMVNDEAIRKAQFKCECWGCTGRAVQAHLLELPEEHLEPNFDWMNRNNILIALCSHHHE